MNELMEEIVYNSGRCIKCNSRLFDNKLHLVCTNCGLVHGNTNIVTRNWGKYKEFNYNDAIGTCLDSPYRKSLFDIKGNILTSERGRLYGRLRKLDRYAFYGDFENYYKFFKITQKICSYLHLNNIILNHILHLYRKYLNTRNDKIYNKVTLLATCFYIVIKENKIPIKISELSEAFEQHSHRVNQRLIFQTILNLNIKSKRYGKVEDYMEGYLNKIQNIEGFDKRLWKKKFPMNKNEYFSKMRHLIYQITKLSIVNEKGHQPDIMAATIIYFAAVLLDKKYNGHYTLTQIMIGDALGLSDYSIRDIYAHIFRPNLKRVLGK